MSDAEEYLKSLSIEDRALIESLRKVITENDKKVTASFGPMMAAQGAFCFNESGVFKHALVRNKNYFSFHSMVIYGSKELWNDLKERMPKAQFQKGCVNFKNRESFPLEAFRAHMKKCAAFDFSGIIALYQKKKK